MSEQALDLGRSLQILWRRRVIVGTAAALGLVAGVILTTIRPPTLTSQAEVALGSSRNIATQVFVVTSSPVLTKALQELDSPMSLQAIRDRVRSASVTSTIVSVTAQGDSADQAEGLANAVANSYVAFIGSTNSPGLRTQATVLQPATSSTGASLFARLLVTGVLGALLGLLIGAIVALATGRRDNRLRKRDEIAGSIGIPVLASLAVRRPSEPSGWVGLLQEYEPGSLDAWHLRMTLHKLGLTESASTAPGAASDDSSPRPSGDRSLTFLSLSSDPKALALGPQVAAFAASLGITTVLVIGPQQDVNATATLRAACAGLPKIPLRSGKLRVIVSDRRSTDVPKDAMLTVVVAVVDAQNPDVARTMRATQTVLGISAGTATAEQLARVAASAAADFRDIVGVVVADPDPDDHTTGRVPELLPAVQRRTWIRASGLSAETRVPVSQR